MKKIAVIGAGSSGLITLKYLIDAFPEAEIICYEKSDSVRGCWGDMRSSFVSTSTKYTTQFSCFQKYDANTHCSGEKKYQEFFCGSEFGDYLESFAEHFNLTRHIKKTHQVQSVRYVSGSWEVHVQYGERFTREVFDALFFCTGLVSKPNEISLDLKSRVQVATNIESVCDSKVVVIGGGESAVDIADTLAEPQLGNTVYLSLRSGIRVSPRYHPIRGVPSDFLRNRLLLSIDENIRNWIGERFVTFRIMYQELLEKYFAKDMQIERDEKKQEFRKNWELKLQSRAKDGLFNVFHNKSDRFLDSVAERRIQIVGPSVDNRYEVYQDFDHNKEIQIDPIIIFPSMGYRSHLAELSKDKIRLKDFYLGCAHAKYKNCFLIGFARPIIGNIPSISEMQAKYTVGLLQGEYRFPERALERAHLSHQGVQEKYRTLPTNSILPVEHIPYCDQLAIEMGIAPTLSNIGSLRTWLKIQLLPASTLHYVDTYFNQDRISSERIHTPALITFLLLLLRSLNVPYNMFFAQSRLNDL